MHDSVNVALNKQTIHRIYVLSSGDDDAIDASLFATR